MSNGNGKPPRVLVIDTNNPTELKDMMALALYGVTNTEALAHSICVSCKCDVTDDSFRDVCSIKEYSISALCQNCQDGIFGAKAKTEVEE